jgi:RimJ/RimL family protein N-acetyltransferase
MAGQGGGARTEARPTLVSRRVRLRPRHPDDAEQLHAILAEPSVSRWWGEPDPAHALFGHGHAGRYWDTDGCETDACAAV